MRRIGRSRTRASPAVSDPGRCLGCHANSSGRSLRPLLIGGLLALAVAVIIVAVIAISTVAQAKRQYDTLNWQAGYYGLPTQPFSTPDWTQIAPKDSP